MLLVFSFYFTSLSLANSLVNYCGNVGDLNVMITSQVEAYLPWNYFSLMK